MSPIILAEGEEREQCFRSLIENAQKIIKKIPEKGHILIIADFLTSAPFPVSVHPHLLSSVLKLIEEGNGNKVFLLPSVIPNIKLEEYFKYTPYNQFLGESNVEIITTSNLEDFLTTHEITGTIILTQLKIDIIRGLYGTIATLDTLFKHLVKGYKERGNKILKISEKLNLCFTIVDAFEIMTQNGPFLEVDSSLEKTGRMILSENLLEIDLFLHTEFSIPPSKNAVLNYIINVSETRKGEYQIANYDSTQLSTLFTSKKLGIKKNPIYLIQEKLEQKGLIVEGSLGKEEQQIAKDVEYFKEIPGLHGLTLIVGKTTREELEEACLFLNRLRTLLYKDSYNLETWAIVIGKINEEEIDEEIKTSISATKHFILYGDDAIISTEKASFRKHIELKEVLTGDDLEKLIYQKQLKVRAKIDKIRNNYEIVKEEIREKIDEKEKAETLVKARMKMEIKIRKLEDQVKIYRIKQTAKQEINKIKNKIPKVTLNERILEIEGNPPKFSDALFLFSKFWEKYDIASLHLFLEVQKQYWIFPSFDPKIMKKKWKQLQSELQAQLKKTYAEIRPDLQKEIKIITKNMKNEIKLIKKNQKTEIKKIKEKAKEEIKSINEKFQKEKKREIQPEKKLNEDLDKESDLEQNKEGVQ